MVRARRKQARSFEIIFGNILEDELGDYADKVNLIGRWHDLVGMTGVAIIETDDINAINSWLLKWSAIIDITATPVMDDEETKQIGRTIW